ncbi:MAG: tRNA (adenosine(37)-N6)-dimethylallyltransferase MiaA [Kiritimatiellae bacterium]|nr:tRNA (adenosine(37)-N6)-dimethylallyltransferase MiaA [Kiritimatiellia bacterium]
MSAQLPTSDARAWFLVGPTASGKSAVGQSIAEQWPGDILSADAMLVYIGMDIGTAKPTAAERARVRYYGLDLVDPREPFSAGAYRVAALRAIQATRARSRPLIVVGGTGLYIKSLIDGLAPCAPGQSAVREEAGRRLAAEGIGALQAWLRRVDPARYSSLADPQNSRRLIRALETALIGEAPAHGNWREARDSPRILGLKWSLPQLYDRIEARVQAMFAGGLPAEVERLLQAGFEQAPTASHAIGYAEAAAYLRAKCSLEDAMNKTAVRSRQLAKRQMTWFRHQCNVEWLDVDSAMTTAEIAGAVRAYWQAHGPTPLAAG